MFLLDIEVELAWGIIDQTIDKEALRKAAISVRKHLGEILRLLDKYNIPVTWGIIGHLILDRCQCTAGEVPHSEMPRPAYKWIRSDWYQNDPCKTLDEEPAFYGKDIVDKIVKHALEAPNTHDIACHSFSHQIFGDQGCSKVVAEAEVASCLNLLEKNYEIRPSVFVFPRDSVGHLGILRREGFVAFRGPISRVIGYPQNKDGKWNFIREYVSNAVYLASFYLGAPPPVTDAKTENGLINIPASLCYNKKPLIPLELIVRKAKKGIDRAVEEKKIMHLYTHLINFGTAPDVKAFIEGFENILAHASSMREGSELEITTMRLLAANLKRNCVLHE